MSCTLQDLDHLPCDTYIVVDGAVFKRTLFAAQTMPARGIYPGWQRLEQVRGDATEQVAHGLRMQRGGVHILTPTRMETPNE